MGPLATEAVVLNRTFNVGQDNLSSTVVLLVESRLLSKGAPSANDP